jgi:hypothetical protein
MVIAWLRVRRSRTHSEKRQGVRAAQRQARWSLSKYNPPLASIPEFLFRTDLARNVLLVHQVCCDATLDVQAWAVFARMLEVAARGDPNAMFSLHARSGAVDAKGGYFAVWRLAADFAPLPAFCRGEIIGLDPACAERTAGV